MKTFVRVALLVGLSAILLSTTGCLEERETLTVYPSGAGKIRIYQKFGTQLSGMITGFAEKGKEQETINTNLYRDLGKWQGVSAWAGVKATLANGQIINEATGYFDNVNALKKAEGDNVDSFLWTALPAGGFSLTWKGDNKNRTEQQPFKDTTKEEDQTLAGMMEMMKGLRIEHTVVLPGTVEKCLRCTERKDRSALRIITDDEVVKIIALQKDYRARIASKQITKEQATAEFNEKTRYLEEPLQATSAAGNVNAEFAQFQREYQTATKEFVTSGMGGKIQQAAAH